MVWCRILFLELSILGISIGIIKIFLTVSTIGHHYEAISKITRGSRSAFLAPHSSRTTFQQSRISYHYICLDVILSEGKTNFNLMRSYGPVIGIVPVLLGLSLLYKSVFAKKRFH